MTDAEYLFHATSKESKRIGRGAFNKKGGARSKKCTLPSDYLSAKEKKERNGIVMTWNLNAPMDWKSFKSLPDSLLEEYMANLVYVYNGRQKDISNMLGISSQVLWEFLKTKHLSGMFKRTGKKTSDPKWVAFMSKQEVAESFTSCPVPEHVEEPIAAPAPSSVVEQRLPDVCVEIGTISYTGLPAAVFESAFRVLLPNTEYRIRISFSKLERDVPDTDAKEVQA